MRVQIAEALAVIGRPAVPGVLRLLAHTDLDLRAPAITILGAIGDRRALAAVLDQLQDADAGIRLVAADALTKLADASAIPALLAVLDDAEPEDTVAGPASSRTRWRTAGGANAGRERGRRG